MTTRYFVFAGEHYYPEGGMNDYRGSTTTIMEAIALVEQGQETEPGYKHRNWDWANIAERDAETGELVMIRRYYGGGHADLAGWRPIE